MEGKFSIHGKATVLEGAEAREFADLHEMDVQQLMTGTEFSWDAIKEARKTGKTLDMESYNELVREEKRRELLALAALLNVMEHDQPEHYHRYKDHHRKHHKKQKYHQKHNHHQKKGKKDKKGKKGKKEKSKNFVHRRKCKGKGCKACNTFVVNIILVEDVQGKKMETMTTPILRVPGRRSFVPIVHGGGGGSVAPVMKPMCRGHSAVLSDAPVLTAEQVEMAQNAPPGHVAIYDGHEDEMHIVPESEVPEEVV